MFTHREDYHHLFGENLERIDSPNGRKYLLEEKGLYLPSVTTVLSHQSKEGIAKWRNRVGEEAADRKSKHASTRGTRLHTVHEYYLNNIDVSALSEYQVPLIKLMFAGSRSKLDKHVDVIYQQETQMFSERLGVAGTVDLICEFDGELAVVDFKTSEKIKPERYLENYFVQLSAYWGMFSEKTGIVPKKLVVFLVTEAGEVQIVERTNIMHYLKKLTDYVHQFNESQNA
jgi:genome maintenance exonuclease 1